MQLTVTGFSGLSKFAEKAEKAHKKAVAPSEASAMNKAAAAARKGARKTVGAMFALPKVDLNKRIWLKRADSRKPVRSARVSGGQRKFSASYQRKKGGISGLVATQGSGFVKVGGVRVTDGFIGYSKHYGRHFVGKRRRNSRDSMVHPGWFIGNAIEKAVKGQEAAARRQMAAEYLVQYNKRFKMPRVL